MTRHPLALLVALIVIAGAELAAFNATSDAEPEQIRFVVMGSCLLVTLAWFLARLPTAAKQPAWPSRKPPTDVIVVDADTRRFEALVSPEAPASYTKQLAELLASQAGPDTDLSPSLARYLTGVKAGRRPTKPSPTTLAAWLTELEQLK